MNAVKIVFIACLFPLLVSCAGSAPDFGRRTEGGPDQEAKLAALFDQAAEQTQGGVQQRIVAPFCSSTVGRPTTGWSIDAGNWCIVGCNSAAVTQPRWVDGTDGSRCLAAPAVQSGATKTVETDFMWSDLSLAKQTVFNGLSRSFLSDTEWHCEAFSYLIDPDSRKGFWNKVGGGNVIYRFHRDGRLLTGPSLGLMKLSGSWRVGSDSTVYFNSTAVFKNAIDYGGGRFDNFKTATNKEVCRFVREAGS